MPPPVDVAAGLVFRDGKLLITQRPASAHLGNLWEFPGGKREAGESFEECLRRELREELGMDVAVGPLIEELTHNYPEVSVHLRFYGCEWRQHEPRPIHCQALAWVAREQLSQYEFPAADARLLSRLAADWPRLADPNSASAPPPIPGA